MNRKDVNTILLACLVLTAHCGRVSAKLEADTALEIYLPREVTIKNNSLILGQVSIIRGREPLAAKAGEITLGQISVPGQEITIDKQTVLSRLACNGIPATDVTMTGAEKVTIKQQQQIIKGSDFIEAASSFLNENLADTSVSRWEPMQTPKDLIIAANNTQTKFSAHLINSTKNHAKVKVTADADGKEAGSREVTFRLKYKSRRARTLVEIPAGETLSPENIRIEEGLCDYPEPSDWSPPYGLVAKRRIPANTVIGPNLLLTAKQEVLLERNKTVIIRVEKEGLLVTAIGKTMQKGCAGEYIKVRNIDSQRIIVAKVNEDGTVEPVF